MAERKFSLRETGLTQNCNECGRVITPDMPRYFDAVSGHIVHHVECRRLAAEQRVKADKGQGE